VPVDSPPSLPNPKPLGPVFWILLVAPIAAMGVAVLIAHAGGRHSPDDSGVALSFLSLLAMLVCSIICAVMVGRRRGTGLGFLTFIAIQVVYLATAFAGCGMVSQGMSFR
jgi:peptidoglycan/LPS O-acetylase OafA/YrhL